MPKRWRAILVDNPCGVEQSSLPGSRYSMRRPASDFGITDARSIRGRSFLATLSSAGGGFIAVPETNGTAQPGTPPGTACAVPRRATARNERDRTAEDNPVRYAWYASPIGRLLVAKDDVAVRHVTVPDRDPSRPDSPRRRKAKPLEPGPDWIRDDAGLARETAELDAYFAGEVREFEMAVEPEGTPFRRKVWAELARIPYGETWSYGELARPGGRTHRRGARRRRRQRRQPHRDRPSLPPRHRRRRQPRRLRRRPEPQGDAARARAGGEGVREHRSGRLRPAPVILACPRSLRGSYTSRRRRRSQAWPRWAAVNIGTIGRPVSTVQRMAYVTLLGIREE